jgi:hypothetical protein
LVGHGDRLGSTQFSAQAPVFISQVALIVMQK